MDDNQKSNSNFGGKLLQFIVNLFAKTTKFLLVVILLLFLTSIVIDRLGFGNLSFWVNRAKITASDFANHDKALYNYRDRINIAILGQGGDGHDSGDLIDSIQILSLSTVTNDGVLFSIPRDVWIDELGSKINKSVRIGKERGQGYAIMKQSISKVTGLPIHYYVQIDFNGFIEIIDYIGGLEINVENGFVDKKYPIKGKENDPIEANRYEELVFTPGRTYMDGVTALKFARSRYAEGIEGSDLARSRRQQLIINSLKDKLFNSQILLNRNTVGDLWSIADKNIVTDIDTDSIGGWMKMGYIHRDTVLRSVIIPSYIDEISSLVTRQDALLIYPGTIKQYNYEWVFIPVNNDFTSIHNFLECQIYGACGDK